MGDFRATQQGVKEGDLFPSHLASGVGSRQGQRAGHAAGFEQERNLHRVFHGIGLGVERDPQVVAVGLARQSQRLYAADQLIELRGDAKIGVEARRQIRSARYGENRRAGNAFDARLQGGVARRRAPGIDRGEKR